MSLQLHSSYTQALAISKFQSNPRLLCDRQFAVFPDTILCFITIGEYGKQSYLSSPDNVIWKPSRIDYEPLEKRPWFPHDVCETWGDRGGKRVKLRNHHLLIRQLGADDFIYVGRVHLGCYGCPDDNNIEGDRYASFSLDRKIPYDIWLKCGGYTGWKINIGREEYIIERGDLNSFDRLLSQFSMTDESHLEIHRYDPGSLSIYTNSECAHLRYYSATQIFFVDRLYRSIEKKFFSCDCGVGMDFLEHQTISHELAVKIVRHFLITGDLPGDIEWAIGYWDDEEYYREEYEVDLADRDDLEQDYTGIPF